MSFLPIVERELRLAARRKGAYAVRLWTTSAGLLVCVFFLLGHALQHRGNHNIGHQLFSILTFYTFGLSLLAGVFLASDSISAEKRDGTLGLLFLTDLKGYDVVLGKLLAVGISALCGLVAVLPVTGFPLLLGGVTGTEFGRVALALVNALFFSLATGIFISCWSRGTTRAAAFTFGSLVAVVVVLPLCGLIVAKMRLGLFSTLFRYVTAVSPFSAFNRGSAAFYFSRPNQYWISLAASHLFAWLLLLLASWRLPYAWQEKSRGDRMAASAQTDSGGTVTARMIRRSAQDAELLDKNPVLWLAESSRSAKILALLIAIMGALLAVTTLLTAHQRVLAIVAGVFLTGFGALLKLIAALQSVRFFVEARRDGTLEMVMSTPLTTEEMIQGQWLAFRRLLFWPVVIFLSAGLLLVIGSMVMSERPFNLIAQNYSMILIGPFNFRDGSFWFFQIFGTLYHFGSWLGDLCAIGWVGMWFGLSAKKPGMAVFITLLVAVILPMVLACIPNLAIDLVLIAWARQNLRYHLRWKVRAM